MKWLWDKSGDDDDEDDWVEFGEKQKEEIEAAYVLFPCPSLFSRSIASTLIFVPFRYQKYLGDDGDQTFAIDKERHINFRRMRQVRNDDPEKYRKVKRAIMKVKPPPKPSPAKPAKSSSLSTDTTPTKSDSKKKDSTPNKNDTPSKNDKSDTTPTKTDKSPTKNDKSDTPTKATPKKDTPKSSPSSSTTATTTTTSTSSDKKGMGKRTYSDMTEEEKKEYALTLCYCVSRFLNCH